EKLKSKSRREGSEKEETKTDNHREHSSRDKENGERKKERGKEKDKVRERSHGSRHERVRSPDEKNSDREKIKSKHRDKDQDEEKLGSHDDGKHRTKAKDGEKVRDSKEVSGDREDKEREKERARERDRVREKDRSREKARERDGKHRGRDRAREREKRERGRVYEREKHRNRDKSDSSEEDVRDHDRKRRKREEDHPERDENLSGPTNQHREGSQGDKSPKKGSEDAELRNGKTREEELAEEQKKLDEEMERRRRRVQEWQLKRKKEESEKEKDGVSVTEEAKSGKLWTLEGDSDDDEAGAEGKENMDVDDPGDVQLSFVKENGTNPVTKTDGDDVNMEDDEIDPLDAFMNSTVYPEMDRLNATILNVPEDKNVVGPGEGSDPEHNDAESDEAPEEDEDDEDFMKRVKKTKVEKLTIVDHSKIEYPAFRKNFYIEVKEISRITTEEVALTRKELELKIHGKDVPKPIKTWHQTGLSTKILDIIRKMNFEKPMAIQAQALPVIMSGRDCIGIAKTGSGKTLAFVLPMLRHIKDQPPLVSGDGPIGLIMAPTRELVQQIHSDIKKFAKVAGLSCVPVYGGSGVAQQISELKRGAEIVVCTPGRMIDILCTSAGKITNLRRVTYLVMDEADRMFDMGFEPQITRIVQNTRPDRQTVLFSATFPRQVETLARKVLNKPVEIQVGGRSVVNKDIEQLVEIRPEEERFFRLLEILGENYEKGKILIFVHTQDNCDALFKELIRHGYPCLSLHGGKDQTDRESTLSDFKSNVCNILVATSIAARGLDVKELELVVNFDVPNHYEDYVHRVGRTGRAGRKGKAITFLSKEEDRYAPDLVKALELSEQVVPADLKELADGFMAKVNQGIERAHGTGYGGSGFKFNEEEDEVRRAAKKAQAKEYGFEEDKSDSDDEDEGIRKAGGEISHKAVLAQATALAAASKPPQIAGAAALPALGGLSIPGAATAAAVVPGAGGLPAGGTDAAAAARATALAAALNLQHNLAKIQADALPEHYEAELEINDFPQNARWKVTHKETLGPISEWTGAAITTRGQFYPPGRAVGQGDRKLYLFIEGPTEVSVKRAKAELKRVLEDITNQALSLPGAAQTGRYSVM
ncbi:hypothetical protein M569_12274, partial [Genlisea aurea]